MEPEIEDSIFEIETLQDWQQDAGVIIIEEPGGGGSNNCTNN